MLHVMHFGFLFPFFFSECEGDTDFRSLEIIEMHMVEKNSEMHMVEKNSDTSPQRWLISSFLNAELSIKYLYIYLIYIFMYIYT